MLSLFVVLFSFPFLSFPVSLCFFVIREKSRLRAGAFCFPRRACWPRSIPAAGDTLRVMVQMIRAAIHNQKKSLFQTGRARFFAF